MTTIARVLTHAGLLFLLVSGCASSESDPPTITLATTTSTRDSGLLDELVPMFEQQTGIHVKVVAVGSGQALEMGRRGDVDVLLTHAPAAETEFVEQGFGVHRRGVMHNDFVVVGPIDDPAAIASEASVRDAFRRINESESLFISRGDNSGTHMKEWVIWEEADVDPAGQWYLEAGSGMAATLRVASEKQAYALCDRGTFLSQQAALELKILSQGDALLRNDYSVTAISSDKHPHVNATSAGAFAEFLLAPGTQQSIAEFGKDKYGQPLFFPDSL